MQRWLISLFFLSIDFGVMLRWLISLLRKSLRCIKSIRYTWVQDLSKNAGCTISAICYTNANDCHFDHRMKDYHACTLMWLYLWTNSSFSITNLSTSGRPISIWALLVWKEWYHFHVVDTSLTSLCSVFFLSSIPLLLLVIDEGLESKEIVWKIAISYSCLSGLFVWTIHIFSSYVLGLFFFFTFC